METIQESIDEDYKGRSSTKTLDAGASARAECDDFEKRREEKAFQSRLDVQRRTAMGDYIVPPDGDPLTQQAFPTPGPGDYLPTHQVTQRASPHYSIVGRSKDFGANKPAPGPADYDTSKQLIWRGKRITLKGKGKTMITEEAADSTNTIGPAQYNVRYLNTGKHAPKLSVSSRHRDGVNVGHPSNALSGTNHDYPTPGPNTYTPKIPEKGPHKSFGVLHRHGRSIQDGSFLGPGPAAYNVKEPCTKSGYTLAKRLKAGLQSAVDSPAPNSYNVGSRIGEGLAMSIRSRQPYVPKTFGPSPNSYFLREAIKHSDAPSATITYRPFETDNSSFAPGPTRYTISNKTLRKAPRYSFRGICKYPITQPVPEDTPGPCTSVCPRAFTDNDAPAYTMGKRTKQVSNFLPHGPGPNHYNIAVRHRPDGKKAPSFTMAARCNRLDKRVDNPAPTAYTPKVDTNEGPKYSMTSRHAINARRGYPAPNSYSISTNQTVRGSFSGPVATLKGRNTPFVYQGYAFQHTMRLRDS